MMFLKFLTFLFFLSFCYALTNQETYIQVINNLTKQNQCITHVHLINSYKEALLKYTSVPSPREMKNEIKAFMANLPYKKVFTDYTSVDYKICRIPEIDNIKEPVLNTTNIDISVKHMLTKYSYLLDNIQPHKISQMLSYLPTKLINMLNIVHYKIIDHKLYLQSFPSNFYIDFPERTMIRLVKQNIEQLPDMDLIVVTRDQLHMRDYKQMLQVQFKQHHEYDGHYERIKRILIDTPTFMRSTDLASQLEFNKMLIPDSYIMEPRWPQMINQVLKTNQNTTWEEKQQKAFFRGMLSGDNYQDGDHWANLGWFYTRMSAFIASNNNRQYFDFGVTGQPQQGLLDTMKNRGIPYTPAPRVDINGHMKYKYLVSLDGYTAAWQRPLWIMMSRSVLLMQQTYKVQWFYADLLPNIHYVPIKRDFSDIVQKVKFLRQNDEWARNITKNANQFAKQYFYPQNFTKDLINILKQYASFQQWKPSFVQKYVYQNYNLDNFEKRDLKIKQIKNVLISLIITIIVSILSYISIRYPSKTKKYFTKIRNTQSQ